MRLKKVSVKFQNFQIFPILVLSYCQQHWFKLNKNGIRSKDDRDVHDFAHFKCKYEEFRTFNLQKNCRYRIKLYHCTQDCCAHVILLYLGFFYTQGFHVLRIALHTGFSCTQYCPANKIVLHTGLSSPQDCPAHKIVLPTGLSSIQDYTVHRIALHIRWSCMQVDPACRIFL